MTAQFQTRAAARLDNYPSRTGLPARFLRRGEPVVYSDNFSDGPISAALVESYQQHGFVVLEDIFSEAEVSRLQGELQRLWASPEAARDEAHIFEPGDNTLRSIFAVHESNTLFAELAADPRLVEVARFLLGDDVYIHQSRLNYKPGFRGKEFYWHSDFETWHVEDGMPAMRALSISIALTPNDANNGPLMLIPGSHKRFVACAGRTPKNHFRDSLRKQEYGVPPDDLLRQLSEDSGIVTVDAQPGSVIVFDCNTMHGSNSNITPFPRSNAFIVYNAVSNCVGDPYCDRPPRPEYICARSSIQPL